MNNLSALSKSGLLLLCLLLTAQALAQVQFCPPYPRPADQTFVCLEIKDGDATLKLDKPASLYNPVRFVFPAFAFDPQFTITTLTMNFSDGLGPITISSGGIVIVTYAAPGQFTLGWNMSITKNSDGSVTNYGGFLTFQSNFNPAFTYPVPGPDEVWGDIIGTTYTPPSNNSYPSGSAYNAPLKAGGLVNIRYANPDHVMRKPFILVEGFDPILGGSDQYEVLDPAGNTLGYGGLRWDVLVTGRNEAFDDDPTEPSIPHTPQFALLPGLIAQIQARGYDLVYVDFADAGSYIQANAQFLIEVIEQVNAKKVGQEQSVVVGASMGGIVCRYALAKMEQEKKDHCVGLFGTLDTPHNGANIPLSLQGLAWYFHASGRSDLLWEALNTPAARQQAVLQLGTEIQSGRVLLQQYINPPGSIYHDQLSTDELTIYNYAALRNGLVNDLQGVGWPKMPRKIAMLDGMRDGTAVSNHGYTPGDKFYDMNFFHNSFPGLGTVSKISMRSNNSNSTETYALGLMDNCNEWHYNVLVDKMLLTIALPSDFNPCNPLGLGSEKVPHKYHVVHLKSNGNLPALDNAPAGYRTDIVPINALLKSLSLGDVSFNRNVYHPVVSFVPTWSSLAMATPLSDASLFVNLGLITTSSLPNTTVPNFDNFYAPVANLRHVELDAGMVTFILNELTALEADKLTASTLAETYNFGLRRTQIPNLAVLSGGVLNINNTGATGYVNSTPGGVAIKPVFTTYLNDCGQTVTVENGGEFNIGALNRSQHGITEVWAGATVHIKSGGLLRVTSDQSALIIKAGGTLILDAGALVALVSSESKIQIYGTLVWNGDITFKSNGFFEFMPGHTLQVNADAFRLQGDLKTKRFIRIAGDVTLSIPDGKGIDLSLGAIEHKGEIVLGTGSFANFNANYFYGGGGGNRGILGENRVADFNMTNCLFDGIVKPIKLVGATKLSNTTKIQLTTFQNYTLDAVEMHHRGLVLYDNCQFKGAVAQGAGVISKFNIVTILRNSTLQEHKSNSLIGFPPYNPLDGMQASVAVDGDWIFWMDGGEIRDGQVGIQNSDLNDAAPVNIILTSKATIRDCYAGVAMQGNATVGQVILDCARLIKNSYGIYGEDVGLVISPLLLNAQTPGTFHSPNVFINSGIGNNVGEYLHVCYKAKQPIVELPARKNYWGYDNGIGVIRNDYPNNHIWLRRPKATQPCEDAFLADVSEALRDQPAECLLDGLTGPTPEDCAIAVLNPGPSEATVRGKYRGGMDQIKAEQFETAKLTFKELAQQWQPNMVSLGKYCQNFLQSAKSLADGQGAFQSEGEDRNQFQTPVADQLWLFPNPTSGLVQVQRLDGASAKLQVWDAFGKLVLTTTTTTDHFDTASWQSGLYLVESMTAHGQRASTRLVVQH